jgi:hypothetical protein
VRYQLHRKLDQKVGLQCIYFTLSVLNTNENSSGLIVPRFCFLTHVVSAAVEVLMMSWDEFLFLVDSRPYLVVSAIVIILGL